MANFIFKCKNCSHSAVDHSSKTGPRDMKCHLESCSCEKYSNGLLDAMMRGKINA